MEDDTLFYRKCILKQWKFSVENAYGAWDVEILFDFSVLIID